jgi:hypothetical protein
MGVDIVNDALSGGTLIAGECVWRNEDACDWSKRVTAKGTSEDRREFRISMRSTNRLKSSFLIIPLQVQQLSIMLSK